MVYLWHSMIVPDRNCTLSSKHSSCFFMLHPKQERTPRVFSVAFWHQFRIMQNEKRALPCGKCRGQLVQTWVRKTVLHGHDFFCWVCSSVSRSIFHYTCDACMQCKVVKLVIALSCPACWPVVWSKHDCQSKSLVQRHRFQQPQNKSQSRVIIWNSQP